MIESGTACRRMRRGRRWWAALIWTCCYAVAQPGVARDIHVDPDLGDDSGDGIAAPLRTIAAAIRIATAGDTIHLQPKVYHDYAAFYSSHGEPNRPITLDGHGATLDGCDLLNPQEWREIEPGLFRNDDLMPLTDGIVDRWFFLFRDVMNRMGRVSKATSPALKAPGELKAGEWTFVKDPSRQVAAGYIAGAFYIKLAPGKSLADADIAAPIRPAGIMIAQSNSHLVIRNLTATHVYNDGFNISGACHGVILENVRAIDCGDDGISAHTDSQYQVDGFTSIRNATGICDTGVSQTEYRNIFIADCLAHDLFFIQSGHYKIAKGVILSSARYAVTLDALGEPGPCRLELKDVYIERVRGESVLSVAKDCQLAAERVTVRNLDVTATGGEVSWNSCFVGGRVPAEGCDACDKLPPGSTGCSACGARRPRVTIGAAAIWRGNDNLYEVESIRAGDRTFRPAALAQFQKLIGSEAQTRWSSDLNSAKALHNIGADPAALAKVPVPPAYATTWLP